MSAGPPFKTDKEAAEFYGLKWRGWMELKALGKSAGDLLPSNSPAEMPAWFDRMIAAGRRKHRTPDSILERAAAVQQKPSTPKPAKVSPPKNGSPKKAPSKKQAPPPDDDPPSAPLLPFADGEAGNVEIESFYRRELNRLFQQCERQVELGDDVGVRQTKSEIKVASEAVRQWAQSREKINKGENWLPREQVVAGANYFCALLWRNLQTALLAEFAGDDAPRVRRALTVVEKRIPEILPEEFTEQP